MGNEKVTRRGTTFRQRKNNKKKIISIALIALAIVLVSFVIIFVIKFKLGHKNTEKITQLALENNQTANISVSLNDMFMITLPENVDLNKAVYSSSDEEVIRIDAGGRADALKTGKAQITVKSSGFSSNCTISVYKSDEETKDEITTAIKSNEDVLEKNKKNSKAGLYEITVNRKTNTVTVFTYDKDKKYTVPVRAMVCSCGTGGSDITPLGDYKVYFKKRWHLLYGDCYGQYVTGFEGPYLFHSVPYFTQNADDLETEEYNKLSSNASQGCVRLSVADAKWIYENCELDTAVKVVDEDESFDPLGKPNAVKINVQSKWDPTDPDSENPYKGAMPTIKGAKDITIKSGEELDVYTGIKAYDTCSNDVTDKMKVYGNVINDKKGEYYVTYSITDDFCNTSTEDIKVTVE